MTLKEAKKILKKEGFCLEDTGKPRSVSEDFTEFESPDICEAMQVVCSAGYAIMMLNNVFNARKVRLKEEYENNTKVLGPGEEQPKESNPALKEAASQFNDALLDEQAKKIEKLTKENEDWKSCHEMQNRAIAINNIVFRDEKNRLGKEIARLNKIIHKKNMKIEEMRKESYSHLRGKIKVFYENVDLEGKLKDKDAVLSDVAEELRLSKIREKNLTEVCQKYMKENEKLKKELADKVVDKIDAQALKSAESALAYKDEVIETLDKELAEAKHELSSLNRPFRPDSTEAVVLFANAYAKAERKHLPCTCWKNDGKEVSATYILENGKKSKIALDFTGDEIIFSRTDPDKPRKDSLYSYKDKQLTEKDEVIADLGKELEATKNELEEKSYLIDMIRSNSRECCEYGIAAEKMIRKMAKVIVKEGSVSSEDYKEYRRLANGYRFNPQLPELSEEEEKKLSPFRDDSVGAVTNQKDCYPVKDNHPTEDNPEEVEVDEILERVRKALDEGHTVSIDYDKAEEGADQSGKIVLCGNGITLSKEEAEIVERCTKNGTELHYSEKDGLTYTNVYGEEMPISCLRGMFHVFTDEEIRNLKK